MYGWKKSPLTGLYEDPQNPFWREKRNSSVDSKKVSKFDRQTLRNLAEKVVDISKRSEQTTKRELWKKYNALKKVKPLLLCFLENSWNELVPQSSLRTYNPFCGTCELYLRRTIYCWKHFHDDFVIEPVIKLQPIYSNSGWAWRQR